MGSSVTALVLAAGANTRLNEVIPPYMKPLLMVNGKTLISHALDYARDQWDVTDRVVVCSPMNAAFVSHQASSYDTVLVQPQPLGVIDAIERGLRAVGGDWTLLLCSDNVFDLSIRPVDKYGFVPMVGLKANISNHEAKRFMRLWTTSPDNSHMHVFMTETYDSTKITDFCWVGPLFVQTERLRDIVSHAADVEEMFKDLTFDSKLQGVVMNCIDVGTPEALDGVMEKL